MLDTIPVQRLDVVILDEYKDSVIAELHRIGITQIDFLDEKDFGEIDISRDEPLADVLDVSDKILKLNRIIDILGRFEEVKEPFLDTMLGVKKIESVDAATLNPGKIWKIYDEVIESDKLLAKIESEKETLKKEIESIRNYPEDLDLSSIGEGRFIYSAAFLIDDAKVLGLKHLLDKSLGEDYVIVSGKTIADSEKGAKNRQMAIATLSGNKSALEEALSGFDVHTLETELKGPVGKNITGMRSRLEEIEKELNTLNSKLHRIYKEHYHMLLAYRETLEIEKEKCEIFVSGGRTKRTSIMRMWVPKTEVKRVTDIINKKSENCSEIIAGKSDENAPIIMENPKAAKPFEMLTRLYGSPKYGHIDPTIFLMPTFVLFTGMMINDAAYGVILAVMALWLNKKYSPYSKSVGDLSKIMLWVSLIAIIFGVIGGEYFGNLVSKYFMGMDDEKVTLPYLLGINHEHAEKIMEENVFGLLFSGNISMFMIAILVWTTETIHNPLLIFQVSLVIGISHLILGTFLGFYDSIRLRHVKHAILHYLGWFMFGGGIMILMFSSAFGSILTFTPFLPIEMAYFGLIVLVIGAIIGFIGAGPIMGLIEVIDFFAFMISYSRIAALMLAAGGIAMAFNLLAGMMGDMIPVAGIVFAIIVFIFGHTLHLLLGTLSAFIQAIRLHYVEHFSRYYANTSGGDVFDPFMEKRVYTKTRGI